jgi:hypothetical protein
MGSGDLQFYFKRIKGRREIHHPKLNEMACEQVEVASVTRSSFVATKRLKNEAANYSFVLRGYVVTGLAMSGVRRSRKAGRSRAPKMESNVRQLPVSPFSMRRSSGRRPVR